MRRAPAAARSSAEHRSKIRAFMSASPTACLLRGCSVPVLKMTASVKAFQRHVKHARHMSMPMSMHMSIHMCVHMSVYMSIHMPKGFGVRALQDQEVSAAHSSAKHPSATAEYRPKTTSGKGHNCIWPSLHRAITI